MASSYCLAYPLTLLRWNLPPQLLSLLALCVDVWSRIFLTILTLSDYDFDVQAEHYDHQLQRWKRVMSPTGNITRSRSDWPIRSPWWMRSAAILFELRTINWLIMSPRFTERAAVRVRYRLCTHFSRTSNIAPTPSKFAKLCVKFGKFGQHIVNNLSTSHKVVAKICPTC